MPPTEVTTSELFSSEVVNALVVEPLFEESVALSVLRTIRTTATSYSLPKTNRGQAGFVGELETLPDAELAPEMVLVTPKKVASYQVVSNEAIADAEAATIIGAALVDALAQAVDDAFFNGASPAGPEGLPAIADAQPVVGTVTDPDAYVDAIAAIEAVGGRAGVIFMSPDSWAGLSKVKTDDTDSNQPVLNAPGALAVGATRALFSVPVVVSNKCEDGVAWVLDTSRTIAVVRMPFTVAVSEGPLFGKDGTAIRAIGRVEFASVYGETVAYIGES